MSSRIKGKPNLNSYNSPTLGSNELMIDLRGAGRASCIAHTPVATRPTACVITAAVEGRVSPLPTPPTTLPAVRSITTHCPVHPAKSCKQKLEIEDLFGHKMLGCLCILSPGSEPIIPFRNEQMYLILSRSRMFVKMKILHLSPLLAICCVRLTFCVVDTQKWAAL
ncbi:hypothetical protein J6590_062664 [Homalodisca vitripennis]|nr:hypothetical protein J6590_062664 [Homalodisca vitripennis]